MSFYAYYPPSGASSANLSVGVNGDPIPADSTLVAGENPSGDLQPLQTDVSGNLLVSISGGIANPLPVQDSAAEASLASLDGKTVHVDTGAVVIASSALPSGAATESTLSALKTDADALNAKSASSDVTVAFDYRAFTYVGVTQKIDTIVYKTGGSGGTTVATQTFGYDGSDRLTSITKT